MRGRIRNAHDTRPSLKKTGATAMTYNFDEIIDHCIFGSSCDPALKKCLPEIDGRKRELTRILRVSSLLRIKCGSRILYPRQ